MLDTSIGHAAAHERLDISPPTRQNTSIFMKQLHAASTEEQQSAQHGPPSRYAARYTTSFRSWYLVNRSPHRHSSMHVGPSYHR